MEGLESSRHFNFKTTQNASGELLFWREETELNNVVVALRNPESIQFFFFICLYSYLIRLDRAQVSSVVFDTSFYTRNPIRDIYSLVLVDELEGKETEVITRVHLDTDNSAYNGVTVFKFNPPITATRYPPLLVISNFNCRAKLQVGEGGLARFKMMGTPTTPMPSPNNILRGAKVFWSSDASYGAPELALREEREGICNQVFICYLYYDQERSWLVGNPEGIVYDKLLLSHLPLEALTMLLKSSLTHVSKSIYLTRSYY